MNSDFNIFNHMLAVENIKEVVFGILLAWD